MSLTHKMGDAHEETVAAVLGGRRTLGSGAPWRDQTDGRQDRRSQEYAFSWDCKSTLAKSIGVTRASWDKLCEQVDGERPAMPLRFYATERLDVALDLVVLTLDDFAELLDAANGGRG